MANRLKAVRTAFGLRQEDMAAIIGIVQSTYSYWEKDNVSIDHKRMGALAKHFKVSIEFLAGEEFTMNKPPELWSDALRKEYERANAHKKVYMEYMWGEPVFKGTSQPSAGSVTLGENEVLLNRNGESIRINIPEDKMDMFVSICKAFSDGGEGN